MEEWKEYMLGDICDLLTGFPFKGDQYTTKGVRVLRGENIGDKYLHFDKRSDKRWNLPFEREREYLLNENDIVLQMDGNVGRNKAKLSNRDLPMLLAQRVACIRANKLSYQDFIYYVILSNTFASYLNSVKTGTSIQHISLKQIGNYIVRLPCINLQQKIASILKSLDDKIEINRRINENLERQAQALFKSWFVDFEPFRDQPFVESELGMIPEGWRVVTLDEMTSKFGTGLNPRKNFKLGEGDNYYVTIKNMGDNRIYLNDKCDKVSDEAIEKINKRAKLQAGDLLFSGIGTIGRVALITEDPHNWNTSESIFNLRPSDGISSEFLYLLLLSDVFQGYVKRNAQGGVQQGIRMLSLKQYKMAIPDSNSLKSFDCIIKPIIAKIKNNDKQIDELSTLRDTLLPRLMSGELKVQEIEESL